MNGKSGQEQGRTWGEARQEVPGREWLRDDALERSQSGRFASAFLVEADGT